MLYDLSFPDNTSEIASTSKREQSSNNKAIDLIIFIKIMTATDQKFKVINIYTFSNRK